MAKMTPVGFEPTPFRTSALSWRLRPLGQGIEFARWLFPTLQTNANWQ